MPNDEQPPDQEALQSDDTLHPEPIVDTVADPVTDPACPPESVEPVLDKPAEPAGLDPDKPVQWQEIDGEPEVRARKLPPDGSVLVAWKLKIISSRGVIFEHEADQVHGRIDGPNQRATVERSIKGILQGGLIDPVWGEIDAYAIQRLAELAPTAAPVSQKQLSMSEQAVDLPILSLPPAPNPGAKI